MGRPPPLHFWLVLLEHWCYGTLLTVTALTRRDQTADDTSVVMSGDCVFFVVCFSDSADWENRSEVPQSLDKEHRPLRMSSPGEKSDPIHYIT